MLKHLKSAAFATVALLLAGAAMAGNSNLFDSSKGTLLFPLTPPNSTQGGSIGDTVSGGMAPVNGSLSYTKVAAATGFSYTFGNYQADMLFEPAGTLAAGYVTLAPAPIDGGKACVFSTQIVTAFYLSANVGQSINNAVTALSANTRYCYLYSASNTTWDRSN